MSRQVWITRAAPGALATAGRVAALGFDPVVAPLLEVRPTGHGPLDLSGAGALAFTSINGVEAFASRCEDRGLPAFAVGAATAAAARAAGFTTVISADGAVTDLAKLIARHAPEIKGDVLHPSAAETVGDLPARRLVVYETVAAPLPPGFEATIPGLNAVLVHSPKAARILSAILCENPGPDLRLLCLSPAVAAPLSGVPAREIVSAALPNEEALLNLLADRGFR